MNTIPIDSLEGDKKTAAENLFALCKSEEEPSSERINQLIDTYPDLVRVEKENLTPLHWAAYNGHTETCRLLLDKGAGIDTPDKLGATPLHWAAYNGHTATCRLLLERGASVNTPDKEGTTPLHWAFNFYHSGIGRALLLDGADPHSGSSETGAQELTTFLSGSFAEQIKDAIEAFKDQIPTKQKLFDENGYLKDDVKGVCYAGLFPELICKPLLQSSDQKDHRLLYDVIQALPRKWKNQSYHQYALLERRMACNDYDPMEISGGRAA